MTPVLFIFGLLLAGCIGSTDSSASPEEPQKVEVQTRQPTTKIPVKEEVVIDTSRPELLVPAPAPAPAAPPVDTEAPETPAWPSPIDEPETPEDPESVDGDESTGGFVMPDTDDPALTDETGVAADTAVVTPLPKEDPSEDDLVEDTDTDVEPDPAETLPAGEADTSVTDPSDTSSADTTPSYVNPWELLVAALGTSAPEPREAVSQPSSSGVTADTITIEGLVSQVLVGGSMNEGVCAGAQARFAEANATGELTREIDFGLCHDDAAQVEISAGIARQIATDDVFAVVPVSSPAFIDAATLNDAAVPYVGVGDLPSFCGADTTYGFGINGAPGCPILSARGYLTLTTTVLTAWDSVLVDQNKSLGTVVHVVEDSIAGADVALARGYEAELLEADLVSLALAPPASLPTTVSWDSEVERILAERPSVVLIEADTALPLAAALRSVGFSGDIAWVGTVDPLDLFSPVDRGALAPLTVITPGMDLSATSSESWQRMEEAAAAIGYDGTSLPATEAPTTLDEARELAERAAEARETRAAQEAVEEGDTSVIEESTEDPNNLEDPNDLEDANPSDGRIDAEDGTNPALIEVPVDRRVVGAGFVEGYLAADFMVRALAATPEPLTTQALHKTLNDGWWYPGLADVSCGGWWPAGHYLDVPCVSVSRVDAFSPDLVPVLGLREVAPRWQGILSE